MNQSRYNWNNSSAPINFYTSSSSTNRIYVSQYDYDAYGITYALERSGSELTRFKIELNSRTITRDASTGNLANFIQSVLVHELAPLQIEQSLDNKMVKVAVNEAQQRNAKSKLSITGNIKELEILKDLMVKSKNIWRI